jgi:sirohydrochlorin cobaltochelatase
MACNKKSYCKKNLNMPETHDKKPSRVIVLVNSATPDPAADAVLADFCSSAQKKFKSEAIIIYGSARARSILREQGKPAPDIAQAILDIVGLRNEFSHVVVQSLHVIPGYEFHEMARAVNASEALRVCAANIKIGLPLLDGPDCLEHTANILISLVGQRELDEAIVFIGHGASHPGGMAYHALSAVLSRIAPYVFLGMLDKNTNKNQQTLLKRITQAKLKRVHLVPLLLTAGAHMKNDIFGQKNSWVEQFNDQGLEIVKYERGLLEYPAITNIFLKRIGVAFKLFAGE